MDNHHFGYIKKLTKKIHWIMRLEANIIIYRRQEHQVWLHHIIHQSSQI